MNKVWHKFYECECASEGIMISKDNFDEELIYLAIFQNNFYKAYHLSFKGKLRAIWDILNGNFWGDNIVLNKETAKELGKDLIKYSKGVKNGNSSSKS